jgi:hypothetical protein
MTAEFNPRSVREMSGTEHPRARAFLQRTARIPSPTSRPRARIPKSVVPGPIRVQARNTTNQKIGNESYSRWAQVSFSEGRFATFTQFTSSRQRAPALKRNVR